MNDIKYLIIAYSDNSIKFISQENWDEKIDEISPKNPFVLSIITLEQARNLADQIKETIPGLKPEFIGHLEDDTIWYEHMHDIFRSQSHTKRKIEAAIDHDIELLKKLGWKCKLENEESELMLDGWQVPYISTDVPM